MRVPQGQHKNYSGLPSTQHGLEGQDFFSLSLKIPQIIILWLHYTFFEALINSRNHFLWIIYSQISKCIDSNLCYQIFS